MAASARRTSASRCRQVRTRQADRDRRAGDRVHELARDLVEANTRAHHVLAGQRADELVAAHPRDDVVGAQVAMDGARHRAQEVIAGAMAVGIVDRLSPSTSTTPRPAVAGAARAIHLALDRRQTDAAAQGAVR